MKRFSLFATVLFVSILALMLSACGGGEPEVVEVTRIITETVVEQVEVTRIVEGEVVTEQIEVTRVVEAPAEEEPADAVEVELWHSLSGDFATVLEELIQEYNESQDAVTIVASYQGNYQDTQQALLAALAAGEPPVVSHLEASFAGSLAERGVLRPVEDFITDPDVGLDSAEYEAIFPGFIEATTFNGTMYVMPFNLSMPVLYYNAEKLADVGVAPPETWDDFMEACQAVTSGSEFGLTINPGNVWVYEAMVWQNNGQLFNEDQTEVLFNQGPAVEALDFWVQMVDAGCAKTQAWEEGRTEFFNGNAAFIEDSSGGLGGILNNVDFELGVTHLPWAEAEAVTIGGGTFGIFEAAPEAQQRAAWDFLKFLSSPEANARLSADTGYLPISNLAMETEPLSSLLETDARRADMLNSLQYLRPRPAFEGYAEIQSFLREAIEQATLQQMSAQEALDQAATQAQDVLGGQ